MSTATLPHSAPRQPSLPRPASPALPSTPALAHREEPRDGLGPWGQRGLVLGVVLVHLAGAWALQRGREDIPPTPRPAPIAVQWIALPTPAPEPVAPPVPSPRPAPRPTARPTPVLAAAPRPQTAPPAMTAPTPAPADQTVPETAAAPTPSAAPAPTAPAAPHPAAAPAGPVQLPANALRYVTMPRQVYPPVSRRLGETGTVLVQVIVDVNGLPRQVTLHRSSGHPRLDEQALQAMRAARFQPCWVEGHPVEAVAIAPLAYSLE